MMILLRNKKKLDNLHKQMLLREGSNTSMDFESGLNSDDVYVIKFFISIVNQKRHYEENQIWTTKRNENEWVHQESKDHSSSKIS